MSAAPGLAELQLALQRFVLGEASDIAAAVATGPGPDAAHRLRIYRHAYRVRLADALRDSYGHTADYLGAEAFEHLALAYIDAHPSRRGNLRWYGADFAPWLALRHPAVPEAAELATLDWALRGAFDGPDATPLGLADLAAIDPGAWARVRLHLHPTAARIPLRLNTVALWHALDTEVPPPPPSRLADPVDLLVWRRGLQPHFRILAPLESAALDLILGGSTFGAMCDTLTIRFPGVDIAREAGTLLRRWVDEELLAGAAATDD